MDYGFDSSSGKRKALRRNDKFNDLRHFKNIPNHFKPGSATYVFTKQAGWNP